MRKTVLLRILSVGLAICLLISALVVQAVVSDSDLLIWNGKNDLKAPTDSDGDGIFEISLPSELAYAIKNGGGNSYILTDDIYLNNPDSINWSDGTVTSGTANSWYASYDQDVKSFSGTLDGGGHTVYGLYRNDEVSTSWSNDTASGLIPSTSGCTIKNLGIESAYISAKVNGGAILGWCQGTKNILIDNCYSSADVTVCGFSTGGIVGAGNGNLTVKNSYSHATLIENSPATAAGIVCNWWSGGTSLKISNCYTVGTYPVVGNQGTVDASTCFAKVNLASNTLALDLKALGSEYCMSEKGYPILKAFTERGKNDWDGFLDVPATDNSGTYLISTARELAWAVWSMGGGNSFKLTNDIYINDVSESDWYQNSDLMPWFASKDCLSYKGKSEGKFSGNIDGCGYAVYGLYTPENSTNGSMGLIPVTQTANISNIGVESSYICGSRFVGGIVGSTYGTLTIKKSFVGKDVKVAASNNQRNVSYSAGGIIGYTQGCKFTIENSYSLAQVTCKDNHIGGIIGTAYTSVADVKNCYSLDCVPYYREADNGSGTFVNVYGNSVNNNAIWVDRSKLCGKQALDSLAGFENTVWYSVKGDSLPPMLRVHGIAMGDVDENGVFEIGSDSAKLRYIVLSGSVTAITNGIGDVDIRVGTEDDFTYTNADINNDAKINVCDLVALATK